MKAYIKYPIIVIAWILYLIIGMGQETDSNEHTPIPTSVSNIEDSSAETFVLTAGEAGEYGELFTINKGTEFEETYYIYRIPAGTYKVTNSGTYPNPFFIYGDKVNKNESGWEEFSDIYYGKVLGVGESDTFTIADGQIIEIHEPGKFLIEKA